MSLHGSPSDEEQSLIFHGLSSNLVSAIDQPGLKAIWFQTLIHLNVAAANAAHGSSIANMVPSTLYVGKPLASFVLQLAGKEPKTCKLLVSKAIN